MTEKQVDISHYDFGRYMTKARWCSIWHQLDEIIRLSPRNVLEIGPGVGLLKRAALSYGISVETLDIDPELKPDHVASVTEMPFPDNHFDLVCAFQILEHVPYEVSLKAFAEIVRVAGRAVIISLPDARVMWRVAAQLPRLGLRQFLIPKPFSKGRKHEFDGEHYWEINKAGYDLEKVERDLSAIWPLERSYSVPENPYHRFMIFNKERAAA